MAYLLNLKGGEPARIELDANRVVIGRSPDCAIVLSADAVSRHHTQIVRDGQTFLIDDLGSRNGTSVNGKRITGASPLSDNALIAIGPYLFAFRPDPVALPEKPGFDLEVTDEKDDSEHIVSSVNASKTSTVLLNAEVQPEVKLRAILEINQNLRNALLLDEVLPKILDSLFRILPQADGGAILLKHESSDRLVPKAVKHRRANDQESLRISRTIIKWVFQDGQAVLVSDTSQGNQFPISQSMLDLHMRSILCAPLPSQNDTPLGIIQIYTEDPKHPFRQEDLDVLVSVAGSAAIAVENAQMHEDRLLQQRLKHELQFARDVQRRFLPPVLPEIAGYEFYAYYEAAYAVGGDYYGFIELPDDRLVIALGDVAGKGIPAALLMAHLSSDIRFAALMAADPAVAVAHLKRTLAEVGLDDKFVTLLFMVFEKKSHKLSLVNAGHLPPLMRDRAGRVETVGEQSTGLPLNVSIDPDYSYGIHQMTLDPGTMLLLYTDGVTEARNPADEMFAYQRLQSAFQHAPTAPREAGEAVIQTMNRFVAGHHQSDDITLICFGRTFNPKP